MSRELSLDDIVTEFLLNTCRPCPPSTSANAAYAASICGKLATQDNVDLGECVPLTTGSVAEFCIEPILRHLGDIDVMFHLNTQLAIPRGHPPPTQLPAEFHNYVQVFEIIDSHLPGYVYLELRYLLTECSDDDNYNAVEYDSGEYASNQPYGDTTNIHGPALLYSITISGMLSVDQVFCVRCLSWPSQAADWPKRHRYYGWPDSATLDRVVNNGCDVVPVAHQQCRQHAVMGKHQWRLSFSRAEIVLINSWMPVQQVVYHMLRYFTKTAQLTDCADNSGAGTLSNYHIKTLMFWACELKSRSWWTDDVNLVRICVQLLHILAKCLNDRRCQHYFINNCNLIDNSFTMTNIRDQLMSIHEAWLSTWFVEFYIQPCLQLDDCPPNISQLFDDVTTRTKLQDAVSALVAWRLIRSVFDLWKMFSGLEWHLLWLLHTRPVTARFCVGWMTELTKIDSHLFVYFTAVVLLHVASRSLRHGFSDELMDILAAVCGQFPDTRRHPNNSTSTSVLSLDKAAKLMKVVANKSLCTMSLIEIELSKAYLCRALRCKDSDSDSIYCLAHVYLAVLYYTTGECQTAIDHCTLVTRSQDHSQCSSHVVQGEILPKIDDVVDNMLGLAELYQSIRTAALKQQRQPQLVSVFTTELLAYYLHIKYLSVTECSHFIQTSSTDEFKRYEICISDTQQLFIGDVLLFLSVSQLFNCHQNPVSLKPQQPLMNTNNDNSSDLVELLQKSAIEHLTACHQFEVRDFGCVDMIVTTDFEALYAYKRDDYQRCLQLSTQNVHTLLYAVHTPHVPLFPEFIQLLDDDIVSLTALMLMVNPRCRDDPNCTFMTQRTLSLYLMIQCQLKLHHSVTSLAQTLDYIEVAQRRCRHPADETLNLHHSVKSLVQTLDYIDVAQRRRRRPADETLNQLTLKLIERKVIAYVNTLPSKTFSV